MAWDTVDLPELKKTLSNTQIADSLGGLGSCRAKALDKTPRTRYVRDMGIPNDFTDLLTEAEKVLNLTGGTFQEVFQRCDLVDDGSLTYRRELGQEPGQAYEHLAIVPSRSLSGETVALLYRVQNPPMRVGPDMQHLASWKRYPEGWERTDVVRSY